MPRANKSEAPTPADWIEAQAAAFSARVLRRSGDELLVLLDAARADGRPSPYRLWIDARLPTVKVREETPSRLPAFCPERHINGDGSFCMNWREADPLDVTDDQSAERWWSVLGAFLRLQERAARLRRWPDGKSRAHGSAAKHQDRAERCSASLGQPFVIALEAGHLKFQRRRGNRFLRVLDQGRPLFSVWLSERRVATLRQHCVCGAQVALRSCNDHAQQAVGLAFALQDWTHAEADFWKSMEGKTCCRLMDNCPLAADGSGTLKSPTATEPGCEN